MTWPASFRSGPHPASYKEWGISDGPARGAKPAGLLRAGIVFFDRRAELLKRHGLPLFAVGEGGLRAFY
jgi:hypothetical protein